MKNKIRLTLDLTFSEDAKITPKDKKAIMANVMEALKNQINNSGIAPENPEKGEYITDFIEIKHSSGIMIKKNLAFTRKSSGSAF